VRNNFSNVTAAAVIVVVIGLVVARVVVYDGPFRGDHANQVSIRHTRPPLPRPAIAMISVLTDTNIFTRNVRSLDDSCDEDLRWSLFPDGERFPSLIIRDSQRKRASPSAKLPSSWDFASGIFPRALAKRLNFRATRDVTWHHPRKDVSRSLSRAASIRQFAEMRFSLFYPEMLIFYSVICASDCWIKSSQVGWNQRHSRFANLRSRVFDARTSNGEANRRILDPWLSSAKYPRD